MCVCVCCPLYKAHTVTCVSFLPRSPCTLDSPGCPPCPANHYETQQCTESVDRQCTRESGTPRYPSTVTLYCTDPALSLAMVTPECDTTCPWGTYKAKDCTWQHNMICFCECLPHLQCHTPVVANAISRFHCTACTQQCAPGTYKVGECSTESDLQCESELVAFPAMLPSHTQLTHCV